MKIWKIRIHFISREIFQYSLTTYLILLLAEMLKQGLVSFFFNLNYLLALVLLSGLAMVLTYIEQLDEVLKNRTRKKLKASDVEYIILISAGVGLFVWFITQAQGILSILISVLAAIIIAIVSLVILINKE